MCRKVIMKHLMNDGWGLVLERDGKIEIPIPVKISNWPFRPDPDIDWDLEQYLLPKKSCRDQNSTSIPVGLWVTISTRPPSRKKSLRDPNPIPKHVASRNKRKFPLVSNKGRFRNMEKGFSMHKQC